MWQVAFWILAVLFVSVVVWLVYLVEKLDDARQTIRLRESELISHRRGEARWPRK